MSWKYRIVAQVKASLFARLLRELSGVVVDRWSNNGRGQIGCCFAGFKIFYAWVNVQ